MQRSFPLIPYCFWSHHSCPGSKRILKKAPKMSTLPQDLHIYAFEPETSCGFFVFHSFLTFKSLLFILMVLAMISMIIYKICSEEKWLQEVLLLMEIVLPENIHLDSVRDLFWVRANLFRQRQEDAAPVFPTPWRMKTVPKIGHISIEKNLRKMMNAGKPRVWQCGLVLKGSTWTQTAGIFNLTLET